MSKKCVRSKELIFGMKAENYDYLTIIKNFLSFVAFLTSRSERLGHADNCLF